MSAVPLISNIARVSYDDARAILDQEIEFSSGSTPAALLSQLHGWEEAKSAPLKSIRMRSSFHAFSIKPARAEKRYHTYLENRGFANPERVARDYGLRWCSSGDFKGRLIFPIWVEGKLVGWTGRAIGRTKNRYKAEPPGDGMQRLLWESGNIEDGDVLAITEGPFDALKVSWAVIDEGVTAVALLTNKAGPEKLDRILKLSKKASRTVILLDRAAEGQAIQLQRQLAVISPEVLFLPPGVKDPGDLKREQAHRVLFDGPPS
jgi:hypothetical protein